MRVLAVALVAFAVLDTVLAVARHRLAAPAAAVAAAVLTALVGAHLAGMGVAAATALAGTIAAEAPLWIMARRTAAPRLVLAGLGSALVARFATAGLWGVPDGSSVADRWVGSLPVGSAGRAGTDLILYLVAATIFLATAGNTLVRLLLRGVGGLSPGEAKAPGGGRIIGSIERVLVFALAVAGEPTAATLVVSAKGILRFAEVRAADGSDVDAITEYVLVGSLASYALALAFVPLAVA